MPQRILETVLVGRNMLSPVLRDAARDVRQYDAAVTTSAATSVAAVEKQNAAATKVIEVNGKAAESAKDAAAAVGQGYDSQATAAERSAQKQQRTMSELSGVLRDETRKISKDFGDEGENAGGKLAQGINQGLVRNSPLIAAAVAGGLALGAPAAIAAAGLVFGGIAAVALKSNAEVVDAWSGLGSTLKKEAAEDAAVLVPVYVRMAGDIGRAFEDLRPQMRDAFADTAPLVDSVSDGVIGLAKNALPGLVTAVGNAGPVFEGLQSLLEDTGTGLGEMFVAMSKNGGSAGDVMEALGQIIGDALPIIGELVGTGSVLAAQILPPVAQALGMVADVAGDLGPLLPAIVSGFVALKAAQAAAGYMSTFAVQAQFAATAMSGNVEAGSKVGGVLSGLGKALPVVGLAFAAFASDAENSKRETENLVRAIVEGGGALDSLRARADELGGAVGDKVSEKFADAEKAAGALWRSLTPLEQALQKQAEWHETLEYRIGKYGEASELTRAAQERYAYWTGEATTKQAELDRATADATATLSQVPGTTQSVYDSLTTYASGLGLSEDATQDLIDRSNDLGKTLADFIDPLGLYTGMLDDKAAAEEEAARKAAESAGASADSWQQFVVDTGFSFDEYMANLQKQVDAQTNWQENMLRLAGRVSQGTLDELARMGPEGAPLVADLVNRSDAELDRFDDITALRSKEATDAWGAQLTLAAPVLAAVGRTAGQGVVDSLAAQLQAGTITVADIARQYGVNLAGGINPVLTALGKQVITISQGAWSGVGNLLHLASGGYTGDGGKYEPKGVVHGGEFVLTKEQTAKAGVSNLYSLASQLDGYANGGLVAFGRRLQGMGARVAEHPAFPPLDMHGHGATSLHYTGHAIDVNTRPGTSALEQRELAPMAALARQLGFRTIFMAPDHYNHLHVDDGGGASIGSAGAPAVNLPRPPSTSPFGPPISTVADAMMQKAYDEATAWLTENLAVGPEGEGFSGAGGNGDMRALGRQIAAQMGWGGQFGAIDSIFTRESGWNPRAQNPTSSAFGIPQFLNATWAQYGGKTTDPAEQIRDGIRYMVDRYGSPNGANAFWNSHHWYHDGGVVEGPPGADVPAVLRVGETVRTQAQETALQRQLAPAAMPGYGTSGFSGGGGQVVVVEKRTQVAVDATGLGADDMAAKVVQRINEHEWLAGG